MKIQTDGVGDIRFCVYPWVYGILVSVNPYHLRDALAFESISDHVDAVDNRFVDRVLL